MTERVILVEVEVTSPGGEISTLRFADRAIRPMAPTDPLRPNAVWDDRLVEAPTMRRALFEDFAKLTPGLGLGNMTLHNGDGGLDAYQGHVWGALRVLRWTEGALFSSAEVIGAGLASVPRFSRPEAQARRVQVGFYDYRAELDGDAQANTYAGTNGEGAVLYEGTADGLKGRTKPLAYGDLTNAHLPAPQVNGAILAHQLHDGAIDGGVSIFDRGAPAGFADQGDRVGAAFDAYDPPAASSVTDNGRGLVKINGDPAGTLTFGCRGDATGGYVSAAGPIMARVLKRAGVPAGRIGPSLASLPSAAPVGLFAADKLTVNDLITPLARAALVAVLPDRHGIWQASTIAPPKGVADLVIQEDQIKDLQADDTVPAPAGVIRVGWGKIYTTFARGDLFLGLRDTDAAARLANTWRWAVIEDANVKARMPGAWRTIEIETALRQESDALALAASLKDLFGLPADGVPRRQWRVTIEMTDQALSTPLGATVALPGTLDGRFLLLAEEPMRPSRDLMILTVWG